MTLFNECDYCEVEDNIIERTTEREVAPNLKESLLRDCLIFYCKEDKLPDLKDFRFMGMEDKLGCNAHYGIHCICSQYIHNIHIIKHIPTGMKFRIGKNCFEKLYDLKREDLSFFKENCKYCDKKVNNKRTKAGKLSYCCDKCMNFDKKRGLCVDCKKKFWRISMAHIQCKACWSASFHIPFKKKCLVKL